MLLSNRIFHDNNPSEAQRVVDGKMASAIWYREIASNRAIFLSEAIRNVRVHVSFRRTEQSDKIEYRRYRNMEERPNLLR